MLIKTNCTMIYLTTEEKVALIAAGKWMVKADGIITGSEKRVHIKSSNGYIMDYTDGEQIEQVKYDDLQFYEMIVQTECVAVKMECLWDSEDVYSYIDKKRVLEYIPGLQEYRFVPVSNNVLAKAEIPFLIFERNRGKCFIEAH